MEGSNMAKLACPSVVPMNNAVKKYISASRFVGKSWRRVGNFLVYHHARFVSARKIAMCRKYRDIEKVRLSLCTVPPSGLLLPPPWPSKPSPPGERPLPAVGTPATTCPPSAGCSALSGRRSRNLAAVPFPPLHSSPGSKAGGRGTWPWT